MWIRGCFLFPRVCAPEVPGYLFFPPDRATDGGGALQGDAGGGGRGTCWEDRWLWQTARETPC